MRHKHQVPTSGILFLEVRMVYSTAMIMPILSDGPPQWNLEGTKFSKLNCQKYKTQSHKLYNDQGLALIWVFCYFESR